MIIIVTGTPGTGKTTISKKIAKEYNLVYLDVNKIIEEYNLDDGYDKKKDCKIIDTNRLNRMLINIIKKEKSLVIDSHLSHYISKRYVDLCIVAKCSLKELQKRLKKRGYKKEKIKENLDAEIFDTCRVEAEEADHKVKVIWTDKNVDIKKIIS